jgi:dTDP-4-dehydrorhamnose 3,5-epimerase-like enzyme
VVVFDASAVVTAEGNFVNVNYSKLPGLVHNTPPRIGDHRGFFGETYSRRRYAEIGIDADSLDAGRN